MKNTLFSPRLFSDTLRRLRIPALSLLAVCVSFTVLPLVLGSAQYRTLESIAPTLAVFLFIGPVLLGFCGFSFLMHRRDSDFYLSLPFSRRCLYVSIVSAITVCIFCTIALCLIVSWLVMLLMHTAFIPVHLLALFFVYFIGSMLVLGALTVALSFTGSYISAFVLGALLLFLPRAISLVCGLLVSVVCDQIFPLTHGFLFNATLNLPFALLAYVPASVIGFDEIFGFEVFSRSSTLLYSLGLAIVYLALGCAGFVRRPSETAERSSVNGLVQHLSRGMLALPFFLCMFTILELGWLVSDNYRDMSGPILVLFVSGLLVYFLYELLTTRSARRLLPALYVLPIVLVVSALLPFGSYLYGSAEKNRVVPPESIRSVYFLPDDTMNPSYSDLMVEQIPVQDERLFSLVSERISGQPDYPIYDTQFLRIKLKNGRTVYRNLSFSYDDQMFLEQVFSQNEAIVKAKASLPRDNQLLTVQLDGCDKTQAKALFDIYRSEIAALDPSADVSFLSNAIMVRPTEYAPVQPAVASSEGVSDEDPVSLYWNLYPIDAPEAPAVSFYVMGYNGLKRFELRNNLTGDTPKTAQAYLDMLSPTVPRRPTRSCPFCKTPIRLTMPICK